MLASKPVTVRAARASQVSAVQVDRYRFKARNADNIRRRDVGVPATRFGSWSQEPPANWDVA
jgi:hypothetical protein